MAFSEIIISPDTISSLGMSFNELSFKLGAIRLKTDTLVYDKTPARPSSCTNVSMLTR